MFAFSNATDIILMGNLNSESCKQILLCNGIRLIAEDTGSNYGPTISIDLSNGSYKVKTIGLCEKNI